MRKPYSYLVLSAILHQVQVDIFQGVAQFTDKLHIGACRDEYPNDLRIMIFWVIQCDNQFIVHHLYIFNECQGHYFFCKTILRLAEMEDYLASEYL